MSLTFFRTLLHTPARRRAAAFALAALAVAAVLPFALPFALAQPDPTGAPNLVYRYYEFSWGTALRTSDHVEPGWAYDLTATNLSGNFTSGESFSLYGPDASLLATRSAYASQQDAGAFNVTFPEVLLLHSGNYTLNASGFRPTTFHVPTMRTLDVTVFPDPLTRSEENVTLTINVTMYGSGVSEVHLHAGFLPADARTGEDGTYVYVGPSPATGTHTVRATVELGGTTQPENEGSTTLTVVEPTRPTLNVTASPGTIPVGNSSTITVTAYDAINGTPYAGHPVRLCGAPLGGASTPPPTVNDSTNGCTAKAYTNGEGRAWLGVHPTVEGRIHVYVDDQSTDAFVSAVTAAGRPLLVAGNASAAYGQTGTVPIVIRDVQDLGALTFVVRYDPAQVELQGVTPSAPSGYNTTWHVNKTRGEVTFLLTTASVPAPSGSFNLTHLHLRAIGTVGGETPIKLNVTEAAHSDGSAFPVDALDGTFRIGIPGDADADGDVDLDDVAAISEVVLGARSLSSISFRDADVNLDGRVSGVDAMMVRQHVAGTRPTLG